MKKVNKDEGIFAIVAAIAVLLLSLISNSTAITIAVLALLGFGIWELSKK